MPELRSETVAIHAGRAARVAGEPLNPPFVPAANFHEAGYAREQGSPGWAPLEAAIGALEGGTTIAFASGMAAISAVVETLPHDAKVVGPAAGLPDDPGHERATRLMDGYGAMLAFEHPDVGCEHVEDLWGDLEQAL